MSSPSYDVIIIGCGALGSAALYHLAQQGYQVLALDRFPPGHNRGSSHGESRVIRQAYFEHPDYVPLLLDAYRLWEQLEAESGEHLYHQTGVLQIGPESGDVIPGVLRSAREHSLPISQLSPTDLAHRFPGFLLPDGHQAVLEQRGGFLRVEACIRCYVRLAKQLGADAVTGEAVIGWAPNGSGVSVQTEQNSYRADALILTAGAWADTLLPTLAGKLKVLRKHLHWFDNADPAYRADQGAPVFFYELDDRCFYGFPQVDGLGVKVSEHTDGEAVADPLKLDQRIDRSDLSRIQSFLQYLPGVGTRRLRHEVCMYTMSPDGDFVIDYWPDSTNVAFAAGLSGHGFKFASVLGAHLAAMVTDGPVADLAFLSAARLR